MKTKPFSLKSFKAIVDTREQDPFPMGDIEFERGTLCTGDYSVKGLENYIRIERKSLADLVMCVGRERERFARELIRLRGFAHRAVIVESTWEEIYSGNWRSKIPSKAVTSSIARWVLDGIPFIISGNRPQSSEMCQRLLFLCAKSYYNLNKSFTCMEG